MLELKQSGFHDGHRGSPTRSTRIRAAATACASARERDYRTIVLTRPPSVSPARFIAEIGESAGRAGHAGAGRRRRADRHGGHRPGRADLDGRGDPRQPDGARHRDADRLAAGAVLRRARPWSRRDTQVDADADRRQHRHRRRRRTCRRWSRGLNQIGLKPTGIIAILQAIKTAGALQAELVVQ